MVPELLNQTAQNEDWLFESEIFPRKDKDSGQEDPSRGRSDADEKTGTLVDKGFGRMINRDSPGLL